MPRKASVSLTQITQIMQKGGEIQHAKTSAEKLEHLAEQQGLAFFRVGCDKARNASAVLRAIAKSVDYPVFFGTEMDALLTCLNDTLSSQKLGMVLFMERLHAPDPELKEVVKQIIQVFEDVLNYAKEEKRIFVYCIDYAEEHALAEPGQKPLPYGGVE